MAGWSAILFTLWYLCHLWCAGFDINKECASRPLKTMNLWINENGTLNADIDNELKLDMSGVSDPYGAMHLFFRNSETMPNQIKYLSLANNGLERIPWFSMRQDTVTIQFVVNLEYLSLMGNNFSERSTISINDSDKYRFSINATGQVALNRFNSLSLAKEKAAWATDLDTFGHGSLVELDLRSCKIGIIHSNTFANMVNLRYLYLSGNNIIQIKDDGFKGLINLIHLDLSKNRITKTPDQETKNYLDGLTLDAGAFSHFNNLVSLDLSYTKIVLTCLTVLRELGPSLMRLSLCQTQIPSIQGMLNNTRLKYLDISGNIGIQDLDDKSFNGIEDTLEILHARRVSLINFLPLRRLKKLTTLNLSGNNIAFLDENFLKSVPRLVIFDISSNRISSWYNEMLQPLVNLKVLSLKNNNINLLSPAMLKDFATIEYLAVGQNEFVCNCFLKHFIDTALRNTKSSNETIDEMEFQFFNRLYKKWTLGDDDDLIYNESVTYYVDLIENGKKFTINPQKITTNNLGEVLSMRMGEEDSNEYTLDDFDWKYANFSFKLLDYENWTYTCMDSKSNDVKPFEDVAECRIATYRDYNERLVGGKIMLYVVLGVTSFVCLCIACIIWKWWYVRYFFIMLKNTTILSLLGKEDMDKSTDVLFHYDVFVSYCNGDRDWVLDKLLPHIEHDCSINVCLHERDFQVGLSILENIISGIDRSRTILLVVSKEFLLSQWCQFEMHLAQHRLLETRREQLILVLLQDIPRRKRPNTLHYLMMTKTYLIWPKNEQKEDEIMFWKRLKKTLLQGKYKANIESVSTA